MNTSMLMEGKPNALLEFKKTNTPENSSEPDMCMYTVRDATLRRRSEMKHMEIHMCAYIHVYTIYKSRNNKLQHIQEPEKIKTHMPHGGTQQVQTVNRST